MEAEQKQKVAEAEAEARAKADKWDGKLPQNVYAGAPVPFLNVGSK